MSDTPLIQLDFAADPDLDGRPGDRLIRDDLARLYAHPGTEHGWVRTNFVATVDGSAVGADGKTGSINTPADNYVFALQRAVADVVLVGAGTVRAEGYRAIELSGVQRDVRAQLGLAPYPVLAVITSSLNLDPSVVGDGSGAAGPVLILTSEDSDDHARERLRSAGAEVISFAGPTVEVGEAVDSLVSRGLPRILCEGGATLHHRLLDAGRIDDVCLTLSARMVGGDGGRIVTGAPLSPAPELDLVHLLHSDDGALFARYLTRR